MSSVPSLSSITSCAAAQPIINTLLYTLGARYRRTCVDCVCLLLATRWWSPIPRSSPTTAPRFIPHTHTQTPNSCLLTLHYTSQNIYFSIENI